MSERKFKVAKSGKLAPPETYSTVDLAVEAGRNYWPNEAFLVQEVRDALLSDFLVPANVLGDIREQMAAKVGSETPLDDAITNQTFDGEDFAAELRVFADAYAEATGLKFEGFYIVERQHVIHPPEPEPEAQA